MKIYQTERETTRKKYVASLESRTPEQIAEEEALYIELKRLEQNERRFKRERDELLRTLVGIESGLPEVIAVVDEEGPVSGAMMMESASKRKRRGTLDTPSTPSNVISLAPPAPKRAQSVKSAHYGAWFVYLGNFDIDHGLQTLLTVLCVWTRPRQVSLRQRPRTTQCTSARSNSLCPNLPLPRKSLRFLPSWGYRMQGLSCPRGRTVHSWNRSWMRPARWWRRRRWWTG